MTETELRSSIVNIYHPQTNKKIGTGFVIHDGLVLTCAHVLSDAGYTRESQTVIFTCLEDSEQRTGRVKAWQKDDNVDFAAIQPNDPLPEDVRPLPCWHANGSKDHPFQSYGYRPVREKYSSKEQFGNLWDKGEILGLVRQGNDRLQLKSKGIRGGMSGAPVWDDRLKRVIGIVSEAYYAEMSGKDADLAFALPMDWVQKVWDELSFTPVTREEILRRERSENLSVWEVDDLLLKAGLEEEYDTHIPPTVKNSGKWKPLWQPPVVTQLIGREEEQAHLLMQYHKVRDSQTPHIVFILGKHGTGRTALAKWLHDEAWVLDDTVEMIQDLDELEMHRFARHLRGLARQKPTLFVIDKLDEQQNSTWIESIKRAVREFLYTSEPLPLMLVITLYAAAPLEEMTRKQHTEFTRFAETLASEKQIEVIYLGEVTTEKIKNSLQSIEYGLAERLFELTGGDPLGTEIVWREWQEAKAVIQDNDGIWRAVKVNDIAALPVYGDVGSWARDYLVYLCDCYEGAELPYDLETATNILACAATEGRVFTLEAVAEVLHLDVDELITFFDEFLSPYEDDNDPTENEDGIVEFVEEIEIDVLPGTNKPIFSNGEGRFVTTYQFVKPIFYFAWWHHPERLRDKRKSWRRELAIALDSLFYPYGVRIAQKLQALCPPIAEPYIKLGAQRASLHFLRRQINFLRHDNLQDQFTAYRLFDLGFQFLARLRKEEPEQWKEGLELSKQLREMAELWQDREYEGNALNYLATFYYLGGQYREALSCVKEALAIREKVLGPEHPSTAASLNNLGYLLQAMGDTEGARPYYERALAIREKVLGPEHPDTATSLNNLGYLLQAMGDTEGARPYYERALAIVEKVLGPEHPSTAASLNNLGYLLDSMGDYEGARPYYERALAIREKVLGPEHPDTATSLNNLGALLDSMGDYEGARPYLERALAIKEKVLGPEHPYTATSLNDLGNLLQAMGDTEGARPYYERALAIREKVLGPEHPFTAASLNNLGALLKAMGDYAGARPYYERALAIFEKVLGPEHPDTATSLNNLGDLLKAMGDYEGARPYYERALAIKEKVLGPEHPDTATSLNNLGALLDSMGDTEGARPYYERALAIVEKVLGPEHPDTAASLNNLGYLLQAMGDYEGTRPYFERALAIFEKVLGPEHPHTAQSLNNLGYLLASMGDTEGALPYLERALAIWEKVLGPEHPHTQIVRRNLQSLS